MHFAVTAHSPLLSLSNAPSSRIFPNLSCSVTVRLHCIPVVSLALLYARIIPHSTPIYPTLLGKQVDFILFSRPVVMSSGFVSAGTADQPVERDDAWLRAQQELEEERRRKAEIGQQNDGKSLFEVLEQNKSKLDRMLGSTGDGSDAIGTHG